MEKIKEQPGIYGCIILSTCNRLEVWASVDEEAEISLYEELCRLKNVHNDEYRKYFTKREGHDAVEHLFYLSSGLKSQILGRRPDPHPGKRCPWNRKENTSPQTVPWKFFSAWL